MLFGSVCSGIEAASVAWEPLGWKAAWFAEFDKAPSKVLAHRFPDVVNHGDMTTLADKVLRREIGAPDVLVGGTPCQSFSVAGLRKGMSDLRGNLVVSYIELANAIDTVRREDGKEPCIVVFENVPGLLSSKDNAFGCFLAGLAGEDVPLVSPGKKWTNAGVVLGPERAIAWRTLDAQWFGLAQRRRRVFVVASAREGFDPGEILLEFDGVRRDSAPSREARESVTHPTSPCLTSSGRGVERTGDPRGQDAVVAVDGRLRGPDVAPTWWDGSDVSQTLDAVLAKGQTMPEKNRFPAVLQPVLHHVDVCPTLRAGGNQTGGDRPPGTDADTADSLLAYAFQPRIARNGRGDMGEVVNALNAQSGETGKGDAAPCVAYGLTGEVARTLSARHDSSPCIDRGADVIFQQVTSPTMAVRRLMPVECERLQGFPDNWTLVPDGKRMAADGPRYKQLGNSMPVPVMRWIGQRITKMVTSTQEDDFDTFL